MIAGVVDDHVEAAVASQVVDQPLPVGRLADVEVPVLGRASLGDDRLRELLTELVADVGEDHASAGPRELGGFRGALAATGARDQDGLAGEAGPRAP